MKDKKNAFIYGILVLLMAVPVFYYALLASDMYISTAQFAVRGHKSSSLGGVLSLLGGGSSSSASDSYIVVAYIESLGMLERAGVTLDLREHYSNEEHDFWSRLKKDATDEEFLEYWKNVVRVSYDSMTGVMTLEVRAYTPEMAQAIGKEVMNAAEELMNLMNTRAQKDTLNLAMHELKIAENRFAKAARALNQFREKHNNLDPEATARSRVGIIAGLEGSISKLTVELETKRQFMQEDSFAVQSIKKHLNELQTQLEYEKSRITGERAPEFLQLLSEYESLNLENQFARGYYLSALSSIEKARIDIESKSVYLEAFQAPTLPQLPLYPERLSSSLLAVVVVILGFSLILMIIASIKEHIGA